MDFGELVPVAGIMAGLGFAWIGLKHRELMVANRHGEEQAASDAAENKALRERLAVLERIVTDRGAQTADQIEALRERA